jgi:hypothetical protein
MTFPIENNLFCLRIRKQNFDYESVLRSWISERAVPLSPAVLDSGGSIASTFISAKLSKKFYPEKLIRSYFKRCQITSIIMFFI